VGQKRYRSPGRRMIIVSICSLLLILIATEIRAQTSEDFERQLKEAVSLFEQNRLMEAMPLFEHLNEIKPGNPIVKECLAFTLVGFAITKTDPQEKSEIRRRARKLLLEAQALGDNSDLLHAGLDAIPEDGSAPPFSSRKDVDDAMRKGETEFGKGDFAAAIAAYKRALILDPNEYEAVLFTGDVYYKNKELEKSGEWFARAISIKPDSETAYRYWGTRLRGPASTPRPLRNTLMRLWPNPTYANPG
jgi:tetratricopeptide (TPR) repeat protein